MIFKNHAIFGLFWLNLYFSKFVPLCLGFFSIFNVLGKENIHSMPTLDVLFNISSQKVLSWNSEWHISIEVFVVLMSFWSSGDYLTGITPALCEWCSGITIPNFVILYYWCNTLTFKYQFNATSYLLLSIVHM